MILVVIQPDLGYTQSAMRYGGVFRLLGAVCTLCVTPLSASCTFSNVSVSRDSAGKNINIPVVLDQCNALPANISVQLFNLYNSNAPSRILSTLQLKYMSGPTSIKVGTSTKNVGSIVSSAYIQDIQNVTFTSVGDYVFQATATLGPADTPQSFTVQVQVPPQVTINSATLCADQIQTNIQPATTGQFSIAFLRSDGGPAYQVLSAQSRSGGQSYNDSFNTSNMPAGKYSQLQANWTVNGKTATAQWNLSLQVLGSYRITCYNSSSGTITNWVASKPSTCTWGVWNSLSAFLDAVILNGSGYDRTNVAVSLYYKNCNNTPPTTNPTYAGNRFRRPANIGTFCGVAPVSGTTVAINPNHPSLACGNQVYVQGMGCRVVQDHGGGVQVQQLDNYGGIGKAACKGWPNPYRTVIKVN